MRHACVRRTTCVPFLAALRPIACMLVSYWTLVGASSQKKLPNATVRAYFSQMDDVLLSLAQNDLRNACCDDDSALAALCLDRGAPIDEPLPLEDSKTPLYVACEMFCPRTAALLLDRGASHSIADDEGRTPLHVCCVHDRYDIARLLLARGASPRQANRRGCRPLFTASANGHVRMVRLLLEVDKDVNHPCLIGLTPLLVAAGNGYVEIARLLLEHGAAVDLAGPCGWTPLRAAVTLQIGDHDTNYGERRNHLDVARLLLSRGADVNVRPRDKFGGDHVDGMPAMTRRSILGWTWSQEHEVVFRETPLEFVRTHEHYIPEAEGSYEDWGNRCVEFYNAERDMNALFDSYLSWYYMLRIRLCVVGPSRQVARRRGFFGRAVVQRSAAASARHGLVDEPHLSRHVASFLATAPRRISAREIVAAAHAAEEEEVG